MTDGELLDRARDMMNSYQYAVAQRVTLAIMFATLYEMWEDFGEDMMAQVYEEYMRYHDSFLHGNESAKELLLEVNRMLDGKLLTKKILDAVNVSQDPALIGGEKWISEQ